MDPFTLLSPAGALFKVGKDVLTATMSWRHKKLEALVETTMRQRQLANTNPLAPLVWPEEEIARVCGVSITRLRPVLSNLERKHRIFRGPFGGYSLIPMPMIHSIYP